MVRQWQELNHGSRYSQSYTEFIARFYPVSAVFWGTGMVAETVDDLDKVIDEMINSETFFIADIRVKKKKVLPDDTVCAAHNEMILSAKDTENSKSLLKEWH